MDIQFHHIGEVVKNIADAYKHYQDFGFKVVNGFEIPKKDTEQRVMVGAVKLGPLLLELLEPLSNGSPIADLYKKGGGIYHIGYQTHDLKKTMDNLKNQHRAKQITPITTSVWDKKPVVFFLGNDYKIFELIEI